MIADRLDPRPSHGERAHFDHRFADRRSCAARLPGVSGAFRPRTEAARFGRGSPSNGAWLISGRGRPSGSDVDAALSEARGGGVEHHASNSDQSG